MITTLLVVVIVAAFWGVFFAWVGREEITDFWSCHRARVARRRTVRRSS